MIFQKLIDAPRLTQEIRQSIIVTALDSISVAGTNCDVEFKGVLSSGDLALLNMIVQNHIPTPLPNSNVQTVDIVNDRLSPRGRQEVSAYEPEGIGATIVTYNYCDKTSWWQNALPITMEVLVAATVLGVPSTTIFNASHGFIVDMNHGHIYDEDTAVAADPILIAKIYINDVLQTSGYTLNYRTGVVTFSAPVVGVVKASYKYATDSYFTIKPRPGHVLSILTVQAQISTDCFINCPIVFEAWVDTLLYGKIPVPNSKISYKNERDFIYSCNGGEEMIKGWGNYPYDTKVLTFSYSRPKPLHYSESVEIRIYTENHVEITGRLLNATFYIASEEEHF